MSKRQCTEDAAYDLQSLIGLSHLPVCEGQDILSRKILSIIFHATQCEFHCLGIIFIQHIHLGQFLEGGSPEASVPGCHAEAIFGIGILPKRLAAQTVDVVCLAIIGIQAERGPARCERILITAKPEQQ